MDRLLWCENTRLSERDCIRIYANRAQYDDDDSVSIECRDFHG